MLVMVPEKVTAEEGFQVIFILGTGMVTVVM
jgi:hypothetical protein